MLVYEVEIIDFLLDYWTSNIWVHYKIELLRIARLIFNSQNWTFLHFGWRILVKLWQVSLHNYLLITHLINKLLIASTEKKYFATHQTSSLLHFLFFYLLLSL